MPTAVSSAKLMALLAGLAAAAAGCGSSNAPAVEDAGGAVFTGCETETRAMPYAPGLTVPSRSGALSVKLLVSQPAPPVKGTNSWSIEVDDATSGAPQAGMQIGVMPYMPDHRHGTSIQAEVVPSDGAPGVYTVAPLYLYMAGYWEIRLTLGPADPDAGAADMATLPICIPN